MRKIRLYLSGGGNRAALGGTGALLYLLDGTGHYRWDDVDEVVGVSGGSQPVAALMAAQAADASDAGSALRRYYEAVVYDRATWMTPTRFLIVVTAVVLTLLPVAAYVVMSLLFVPALIAFPVGLVSIGFVYRVDTWLVARFLADYLRTVLTAASPNADDNLETLPTNGRRFVICSVGLDSAKAYYAWAGGPGAASTWHTTGMIQQMSPIEASVASSSLPTLARLRAPHKDPLGDGSIRKDRLIDGGIGGNFGVQITGRVAQEIAASKYPPSERVILAVDAGRSAQGSGWPLPLVRVFSTVARLARWIQIGNDATYVNDVQDIEDVDDAISGILRVSRSGDVLTGNGDFTSIHEKQETAILKNADLGLFNLKPGSAQLAVACGVVGAYLADTITDATVNGSATPTASMADLTMHLESAGHRLGVGSQLDKEWKDATLKPKSGTSK